MSLYNYLTRCAFGLAVMGLFSTSVLGGDKLSISIEQANFHLANKEFAQAYTQFEKLAQESNPQALFTLALFYKYGWGNTEESSTKACTLFLRSAELGVPKGQHEYGLCIERYEVENADNDPSRWFSLAYENGIYEAACDIGRLYLDTHWKAKDISQAIEWCTKAAQKNAVKAQVTLGDIYITYPEVFDVDNAEYWYQQAIDNNSGEAAYKLGSLYLQAMSQNTDNDSASNRALFLMEIASSRYIEKAYSPTAKLYWKKHQSSDVKDGSFLAKSYIWMKAANHFNPTREHAEWLNIIKAELPTEWKPELDVKVGEFLAGSYPNR